MPSADFLANSENKAQLIDLLMDNFLVAGVTLHQAEGDAHVVIVEKALGLSPPKKPVVIVAKDTGVTVISIARVRNSKHSIFVYASGTATVAAKIFKIAKLQTCLGKSSTNNLLFLYAVSGKKSEIDVLSTSGSAQLRA